MSVNKVILLGRLGQDPELKYTPSGLSVCNFSLATSESWKDKQSGQKQEKTEWHRVVVWGKLSELCNQYLSKGRQVYIEGRLQTRSWDDKTGQKRYTTEVLASTVQFIDSQKGDAPGAMMNNEDFGPRDDFSPPEGSSFSRSTPAHSNSHSSPNSNLSSNSNSNSNFSAQNNPQRGNDKNRDYNIPMDEHQFTSDDIPF